MIRDTTNAQTTDEPITHRRTVLATTATALLGGCFGVGGTSSDGNAGDGPVEDSVTLEPIVEGIQEPVGVAPDPTTDGAYFVGDRYGMIRRASPDGEVVNALDVSDDVVIESWEQGLVGFALHPEFASTRKLYVHYTGSLRPGMAESNSHAFVLAEATLTESLDSVASGSLRTLLTFPQPGARHNGGGMVFDDDGNLLVTVGDGGNQADRGAGHAEDWYDGLPGGNGQDVTENLLGSVLRIDPDSTDGERGYGIPSDNPLVGEPGLDEHYAWGFRNPYAISIQPEGTIVADVGEDWYEEVNVVEPGGNYGWNVREGPSCYVKSGDPDPSRTCPEETDSGQPLREPAFTYAHADDEGSTSIIGGHVYRGDALPFLTGDYVFADIMSGGVGQLFAATPTDDGEEWSYRELSIERAGEEPFEEAILGIDRGPDGRTYLATTNFSQEAQGVIYELTPTTS